MANLNKTSKRIENIQTKFNNYTLSTPVIKNRITKKILNINKSKQKLLKSCKLKPLN